MFCLETKGSVDIDDQTVNMPAASQHCEAVSCKLHVVFFVQVLYCPLTDFPALV